MDYLTDLLSMVPLFVALGFFTGLVLWFVCWCFGKVWSLLDIVE